MFYRLCQFFFDDYSQVIAIDMQSDNIKNHLWWRNRENKIFEGDRHWHQTVFLSFPPMLCFFKIQQNIICVKYTVFNFFLLYVKYLKIKLKSCCYCFCKESFVLMHKILLHVWYMTKGIFKKSRRNQNETHVLFVSVLQYISMSRL